MKKNILSLLLIILAGTLAGMIGFSATSGRIDLLNVFLCGIIIGMSFVALKLNTKNQKLDSYKRELEKESVASDENSAKVKVLEQKIEVLEKALENALNK